MDDGLCDVCIYHTGHTAKIEEMEKRDTDRAEMWNAIKCKISTKAFVAILTVSCTVLVVALGGLFYLQIETYKLINDVSTRVAVVEARNPPAAPCPG